MNGLTTVVPVIWCYGLHYLLVWFWQVLVLSAIISLKERRAFSKYSLPPSYFTYQILLVEMLHKFDEKITLCLNALATTEFIVSIVWNSIIVLNRSVVGVCLIRTLPWHTTYFWSVRLAPLRR
jgi:hypothetical protein